MKLLGFDLITVFIDLRQLSALKKNGGMHKVTAERLIFTNIRVSVGLCCIKVKKTSNKVQWKSPKIYVHPSQRYDKGFISFV